MAVPGTRPVGGRLAGFAITRPRLVLAMLAVLLVLSGVFGGSVASTLSSGGFDDPNSESAATSTALFRATGVPATSTIVVLVRAGAPVTAGPGQALVAATTARLRAESQVVAVQDPTSTPDLGLVSRDGRSAYLVAALSADPVGNEDRAQQIATDLERDPRVTVGGYLIADRQVGDQVSRDIGRAEIVAFPLLFLVLVLVLRGLVVALLPIGVGVLSILATFLGLRIVDAEVTRLSIFAVNLVTGIGLGLALDYGLLIVNRYREEAGHHGYGTAALRATMASAGRTVLFSSLTVTGAMACLLVFPQRFLYSMGTGGLIGAPVAALMALTFLPAVLAVLGPRVEAAGWYRLARERARQEDRHGFWYRLAGTVMRRPVVVAVVTSALLLTLSGPFLRISFTSVDASVLPRQLSGRVVDLALRQDFPTDNANPVRVVLDAPAGAAASIADYAQRLSRLPGVRAVSPPLQVATHTWVVDLVSAAPPLDAASRELVTAIRAVPAPAPALVGGNTAVFVDLQASLRSHLPAALLLVTVATLLILFAMTGSLILPLKAIVMNALSVSAAFGLLVLIFQDGRLTGPLAYEPQGGLESTQPILLFAIAFGLSTDYGVFLLQRIREAHDEGLDTTAAVSLGMQRTGRIVTAAAFLFCIAIGAFASSSIVFIKEVGVGTALAVLLDATIVRALLVPALMALLGEWNWWAPRPLRALHRRLRLDRLDGAASTHGADPPPPGTAGATA